MHFKCKFTRIKSTGHLPMRVNDFNLCKGPLRPEISDSIYLPRSSAKLYCKIKMPLIFVVEKELFPSKLADLDTLLRKQFCWSEASRFEKFNPKVGVFRAAQSWNLYFLGPIESAGL
jgi:hypothetical protein